MNAPNAPKTRAHDALSPESFDAVVKTFVTDLCTRFPTALARGPAAFRQRVLRCVNRALSLDSHAPGRPRKVAIDAGHALYQQQRLEIDRGSRERLDWLAIARATDPAFASIIDPAYRRVRLATIRHGVCRRANGTKP